VAETMTEAALSWLNQLLQSSLCDSGKFPIKNSDPPEIKILDSKILGRQDFLKTNNYL
jgi:hypothetical protein